MDLRGVTLEELAKDEADKKKKKRKHKSQHGSKNTQTDHKTSISRVPNISISHINSRAHTVNAQAEIPRLDFSQLPRLDPEYPQVSRTTSHLRRIKSRNEDAVLI